MKKIFAEAGFVLDASNDVLRNPADDRSKPFYDASFAARAPTASCCDSGRRATGHAFTATCPAHVALCVTPPQRGAAH